MKWRLRNERRNSTLMTPHYRDLGSVLIGWKFASTNQKHYCARFSDVIRGETSGGVAKCRLFSQVIDSTEWPTYQHDHELDGPWALSLTLGNEVSKVIDVKYKAEKSNLCHPQLQLKGAFESGVARAHWKRNVPRYDRQGWIIVIWYRVLKCDVIKMKFLKL